VGVDLGTVLEEAAAGRPPAADGAVEVMPRVAGGAVAGVIGFTAHHVVAADVDPEWVRAVLPPQSLSAPMSAFFLAALAGQVGGEPGAYDITLVAPDTAVPCELREVDSEHPRVRRALRYRTDVRVHAAEGGVLILGRGLAGRWEVSLEVAPEHRGRGLGRRLVAAAPGLVDGTLWAQVSPANVASLRMFLAAGYRPVAAEVLFSRNA
jgi:GNAT superfamily N-acetyltransferase